MTDGKGFVKKYLQAGAPAAKQKAPAIAGAFFSGSVRTILRSDRRRQCGTGVRIPDRHKDVPCSLCRIIHEAGLSIPSGSGCATSWGRKLGVIRRSSFLHVDVTVTSSTRKRHSQLGSSRRHAYMVDQALGTRARAASDSRHSHAAGEPDSHNGQNRDAGRADLRRVACLCGGDRLPGAIPVTVPLAETVAIVASVVAQVTGMAVPFNVAVKSCVVP
jgi:hypothetical protein